MDEFQLNAEKDQWCATAPDEISQLVGDINGPLIRVMDDKQLLHDLHEGFPLSGMMHEVGYGKIDDLWMARHWAGPHIQHQSLRR